MSAPLSPAPARRLGPWPRELRAFAELVGACGIVIVQPMFDVAAKNSEVFSTRRISGAGLVLFTIVVVLVPPLVLMGVELVVGLVAARARRVAHALIVAALLAVWVLAALKHATNLGSTALVVAAAVAGGLAFVLVLRVRLVHVFLQALAVAVPAFAALFLFASPVTDVVFGADARLASVTATHPHRVVWISFDEMPETSLLDGSGHVDREMFPNFAALADAATWYRNSTTVAPYTIAAMPAMLTGRMPTQTFLPAVLGNYPHNLFTLLGRTYDAHVHESFARLCPAAMCRGAATSEDAVGGALGDATRLWSDFVGPDRAPAKATAAEGLVAIDDDPVRTAARFTAGLHPTTTPTLDFLHVLLPHWPWHYRATLQDDGDTHNLWGWVDTPWPSEWSTVVGRQRHLLQVQATDTVLGRVMRRLHRIGAWDDSLIVVTADHGIGFSQGDPPRGLATAEIPDIVWTPLFVKYPAQATGRIDDRPARTVDVLPTVAQVLGVEVPWAVDGTSLLGAPATERTVSVFHWPFDRIQPGAGSLYNTVDRATGFARVLAATAVDGRGDPALRLYRTGPYGDMVGRATTGLLAQTRGTVVASVAGDASRYDDVRPTARRAPWLAISGQVSPNRGGVDLAIAVNGTVVAVTRSVALAYGAKATWSASLPPQAFGAGTNDVQVYEVSGPPTRPVLHRTVAG